MEDNLSIRRPQWKTTTKEDDHNGEDLNGRPMTSIEQVLNGRWPKWMMTTMEDNHNVRRYQWKTILIEENTKEALQEADDISLPS